MRGVGVVKREIQLLSARRTELWQELGRGSQEARAELRAANARIAELWLELRHVTATLRAGSPDAIIASARRAERAERELRRRVPL